MKKAKMIVPLLLLAGLDDLQVDRKEEHQQLAECANPDCKMKFVKVRRNWNFHSRECYLAWMAKQKA